MAAALLACTAGCGAAEETAETGGVPAAPTTTSAPDPATSSPPAIPGAEPRELELDGWGRCLATAVRWQLNETERVGFCVARNDVDPSVPRFTVACALFRIADLSAPPDDAELRSFDEPPTPADVSVWETEGCELAYPAARDWLAAELAKL